MTIFVFIEDKPLKNGFISLFFVLIDVFRPQELYLIPPLLIFKGGSFEPLEPPLLRAWNSRLTTSEYGIYEIQLKLCVRLIHWGVRWKQIPKGSHEYSSILKGLERVKYIYHSCVRQTKNQVGFIHQQKNLPNTQRNHISYGNKWAPVPNESSCNVVIQVFKTLNKIRKSKNYWKGGGGGGVRFGATYPASSDFSSGRYATKGIFCLFRSVGTGWHNLVPRAKRPWERGYGGETIAGRAGAACKYILQGGTFSCIWLRQKLMKEGFVVCS